MFTSSDAGTWPAVSCARIAPKRFPLPGSAGMGAHLTFSWAAAWIALYSSGATTPGSSSSGRPSRPGCGDRARVDRDDLRVRAVAVGALPARADDPAVHHARDPDAVDVGVDARHLRRDVDALRAGRDADERVLAHRLGSRCARREAGARRRHEGRRRQNLRRGEPLARARAARRDGLRGRARRGLRRSEVVLRAHLDVEDLPAEQRAVGHGLPAAADDALRSRVRLPTGTPSWVEARPSSVW